MSSFSAFRNGVARRGWQRFGTPITIAVEDDAIGAMSEPIEGGRSQWFVRGERIAPLAEVEIAGEQGRGALVAFGHQVVEGFVLGRAPGFEAEIIDDEERHVDQGVEAPLVGSNGLGLAQAGEQLGLGGEQHVVALAGDEMADGLSQMAFPRAAQTNNILPINTLPKPRSIIASIPVMVGASRSSGVTAFAARLPTLSSNPMAR